MDGGDLFDVDEDGETVRRRSTIYLDARHRAIRRIRLNVYNYLEKPLNAASAPYHFFVFGLVLTTVILGAASPADEDHLIADVHFFLEIFLAVFFIIEFAIRMWSVTADAKYKQPWGRLYYLTRTVTFVDVFVVMATFLMLIMQGNFVDKKTLDYLRFIQILRLLHVDRQMATWKLFRRMIMLSKWQILAAYYITFIFGVTMATIIYTTEAMEQGLIDDGYKLRAPNGTTATFPTLAHSWWFTVVTILTIGYGDIVPQGTLTRIIVCSLGFCAFCTFVAASTQISVGLTLMMEEDNKTECKSRLRNTAASTIQCWYRYHLATNWKPHRKYTYFKHVCYKLYVTEERMNKNRALEKKLKEKLERGKKRKQRLRHQNSVSAEMLVRASIRAQVVGHKHKDVGQDKEHKIHDGGHNRGTERRNSLPETINIAEDLNVQRKRTRFADGRMASGETSISSSCDISDVENHIDLKNALEEDLDELSPKEVDEKLLLKYRPLLRFFNYIMFRLLMKKFQNLRKADQLLTIEAEISECESLRNNKMKQLEAMIASLVGRPAASPFDLSGEKLPAIRRVELCEEKAAEIEKKIEDINDLALRMLNLLDLNPSYTTAEGLPPTPPGKRSRGPKRQVTIVHHNEGFDEDETC